MPRERNQALRDAAWLLDMLTAARAVQTFVTGRTFDQYEQDLLFSTPLPSSLPLHESPSPSHFTPSLPQQ